MGEETAMLWNKNDIKIRSTQIEQVTGTEATNPTSLASCRGKKHPEEQKNSLRKQLTLARITLMQRRKEMVKYQQKKFKKET